MAQALLNTAKRGGIEVKSDLPGPGTYQVPGAISIGAPNYIGFSTSGKRDPFGTGKKTSTSPSPMAYLVRENLIKKQPVCASAFNTRTKRFEDERPWGPLREDWTELKPMGKQIKAFPKPQTSPVLLAKPPHVPSIPMRHQAYGFEEENGKLVLQQPSYPGYSGLKNDTVGPMDYDPKPIRTPKTTNFSKGADRDPYKYIKSDMPGSHTSHRIVLLSLFHFLLSPLSLQSPLQPLSPICLFCNNILLNYYK